MPSTAARATPRFLSAIIAILIAGVAIAHGAQRVNAHTYVYVANYNNSTISIFAERADGQLLARGQVSTPSGPESIVITHDGLVLTADSEADAVSSFRIDKHTGALSMVGQWHEASGANPFSVATTPTGHFAYIANSGNGTVGIFRIATNGRLTADGTVHEPASASPYCVTFTPSGHFAFVANFGNDTIGIYQRLPGHGHLLRLGVYQEPIGDGPYCLAVGPDGRYLYVADFRSNILLVLQILKNGQLRRRDRVVEPFDHHPDSLVIDPSGRYLFVANTSAHTIAVFRISQQDGHLAHVGHVTTGSYPFSLTLDPAEHFAYVVNYGNSTISCYRVNRTTGLLVPIGVTHEVSYADPYGIAAITFQGRGAGP
ncbi:MAG: lactonase family protein [Acidiferrobacter sp.]